MNIRDKDYNCTVQLMLDIVGGKWKFPLLWKLMKDGNQRFGELKRYCTNISAKVLAEQLKELEKDGLIIRKDYDELPLRVEYSISELGKKLHPVMIKMHEWSLDYITVQEVEGEFSENFSDVKDKIT